MYASLVLNVFLQGVTDIKGRVFFFLVKCALVVYYCVLWPLQDRIKILNLSDLRNRRTLGSVNHKLCITVFRRKRDVRPKVHVHGNTEHDAFYFANCKVTLSETSNCIYMLCFKLSFG